MLHRITHILIILMAGVTGIILTPRISAAEPLVPHTRLMLEPTADVEVSNIGTSDSDGPNLTVAYPTFTTTIETRALLNFELSRLPANAVVTKAELHFQQTEATGSDFNFSIHRIIEEWNESEVNSNNLPNAAPGIDTVSTKATTGEEVIIDVTPLVQTWNGGRTSSHGFMLIPNSQFVGSRVFAASETDTPPQLVVEYTQPIAPVTAVNIGGTPKFDGICDTSSDYANVPVQYYAGINGVAYPIYIKHTSTDLYICATGINPGENGFRFRDFSLYLDMDLSDGDSGAQVPDDDDFILSLDVIEDVHSAGKGAGDVDEPHYDSLANPADFGDWDAVYSAGDLTESVEFRISLDALRQYTPWCGAAVGLAVRHENVRTGGDNFGWPVNPSNIDPTTWFETRLQNPMCPIRVCVLDPESNVCNRTDAASVYRVGDGAAFSVDENGIVQNRNTIAAGQQLWTLHPLVETERYTTYGTNGEPDAVTWAAFNEVQPLGEMLVPISRDDPLLVHDLDLSSQWALSPAQQAIVEARVHKASQFLYSFTGGQVLLGDVTGYQNYDNWGAADLWLYANHNLRPKATAGGIITAPLDDPGGAEMTYYPGYIHMGRDWNRYQVAPGQTVIVDGIPIDPALFEDDWAIAFAHEMGHYLFFLFDTYFGISPRETVQEVYTCVGSAMGWVYDQDNWGFISDPVHWGAACTETHANQLLGRDEWETIKLHYDLLDAPANFVPGMQTPPVDLTNVTFVPPSNGQTPLANQVFDLAYENSETASRKAHAFIYQGDRVLSQGNVAKGTTQIELAGAQTGDRFCVYDIDAKPPAPNTPRHQYGCEILAVGDNELDLERTESWRPIVLVDPIGPTSFAISVTQAPAGASILARIYPEHTDTSFPITLESRGNLHTGKIDLPNVTPSAFLQVYVNESESETDPRREAMAMFGVDGGTVPGPGSMGAHAPVYSSDGEALAWPLEALTLDPGQWVSLQYMVETFPNQTGSTRVTDAYRVISWPPDLIDDLVVAVRIPDELSTAQVGQAPAAANVDPVLFIRFWNGSAWQAVPTNRLLGTDGRYLASAIIPTGAPFAVFSGEDEKFLPLLATDSNP